MEAAEEGGDAMRGVHAADRNSQSFFCVFSQILHMDILFDLQRFLAFVLTDSHHHSSL